MIGRLGSTHWATGGGALALLVMAGSWWAQSTTGSRLLPHAFCITGSPPLLWLHVISDALITLAYLVIPIALLHFVRKRRDIDFGWMGVLFGAFIVACGATHAMGIWTLWDPVYWYAGAVKAFTAVVSLGTAWALVQLLPVALSLPSAAQLREINANLEREIAARRHAEAELQAAKDELEQRLRTSEALLASNRDLQQFASVAAHDLRAPLQTMSGYLGLLRARHGPDLGEQGTTLVGRALTATVQMGEMIDGLLSLARLDARAQPVSEVPVRAAVDDALALLSADIQRCEAEVQIGTLPSAWVQRSQLVQLLQNLIGNALKYRTATQPPRIEIRADAQPHSGEWLFSVRDNGIGIAAEHHERVFRIFDRLHSVQKYPGTGLGLAICQRIVMRHGGRIWVESALGQGSTFFFTLPKQPLLA
jgi:signal transduction histidine kinase